jgi:DNA topoisomerase-6 subunit A
MKTGNSDVTRSDLDRKTIALIESIAKQVRTSIANGMLPDIQLPVRSLDNVKYDEAKGCFELGDARKTRALTVNTARSFAQTLRLMATSRGMVEHNDFATKREVYYISKNWGDCRFDEQAESDAIMDDIEAMASMHGLSREQLRFYPESHGGLVAGRLTVVDRNPATGAAIEIDCTNLGSGAYSIPRSVEHLNFRTHARFVLAIETGGMFQRLNNHRFWETARCIIVEMGGGSDAYDPAFHSPSFGRPEFARLLLRRLRPLRLYQYLPHAQGRLGQCGAYQPLPLGAPSAFLRRHATGHRRFWS